MKRPTIPDLAHAAGVSVSTVNRVIHQPDSVRGTTKEFVLATAEEIGFYGLGTIKHSVIKSREKYKLGILLQQKERRFYRNMGDAMISEASKRTNENIELSLEFLPDLSPYRVAERLASLGDSCDSVSLVAAQHPVISETIDAVMAKGVPVTALIGPLSAQGNVNFVGLDNWKVGRTAAWAFDNIVKSPGKVGILLGNYRYRNQELNESGFRSYFREHNSNFIILEPLVTYESATAAHELVEGLLKDHPDLCGLYVSGGGVTGAIIALRDLPKSEGFVAVGYELFDETRTALIDGVMTMIISHPMEAFACETIATMIKARRAGVEMGARQVTLGFEIYTSENV